MVNVTYDDSGDTIVTDGSGVASPYNAGDIAWILTSTALVWIMIPGVGFFYSGLLRRKNALSMIYLSMMTLAVVSFQVRPLLSNFFDQASNPLIVVLLGILARF